VIFKQLAVSFANAQAMWKDTFRFLGIFGLPTISLTPLPLAADGPCDLVLTPFNEFEQRNAGECGGLKVPPRSELY